MTVSALTWFDDDEPRDLRRWAFAALVVLGIHLAAVAAYVYVHKPDEIGDDTTPIAVDFSPTDDTVDQPEVMPAPEQPPPQAEKPPPPPTAGTASRRGSGDAASATKGRRAEAAANARDACP